MTPKEMTPKEMAGKIVDAHAQRQVLDEDLRRADQARTEAKRQHDKALAAHADFITGNVFLVSQIAHELACEVVRLYAELGDVAMPPVSLVNSNRPFSFENFRIDKDFTARLFGIGCGWNSYFCHGSHCYSLELRDRDFVMIARITSCRDGVTIETHQNGILLDSCQANNCYEVQQALERIAGRNKLKSAL